MIGHQLTYTSLIKSHLNPKTQFSLQLPSMALHVLKALHDRLIINAIEYVLFDIHKQTIIHPLIFHSIAQSILNDFHGKKYLSTVAVATGRVSANFKSK